MTKKTGVILFGLMVGAWLALPAQGSADMICTNSLSTCASVSVTVSPAARMVTVTVYNLGGADLSGFALNTPGLTGFSGFSINPLGAGKSWEGWNPSLSDGQLLLAGGTASRGQMVEFSFNYAGTMDRSASFASLNGVVLGEEQLGEGGLPLDEGGQTPGTTTAPEPTTMLLIGTGLVGMAAASRKRRNQIETEE